MPPSLTALYMQVIQILSYYSFTFGGRIMSASFAHVSFFFLNAHVSWYFPVCLKFAVMDILCFKNQKQTKTIMKNSY